MHLAAPVVTRALPLAAQVTFKTPRDLDALAVHTYILGAVFAAAFLTIAALFASIIQFEGGARPRDPGKRRLWYWILLVCAVASCFLYNALAVAPRVAGNLQSRFLTTNAIATGITAVAYVAAGFVLSRMFSTGKLGNWFGSGR
jgi:hypothetical protein